MNNEDAGKSEVGGWGLHTLHVLHRRFIQFKTVRLVILCTEADFVDNYNHFVRASYSYKVLFSMKR